VLCRDPNAVVRIPIQEEINRYRRAFQEKYNSLSDEYGVTDGVKMYLEQSGDSMIQDRFDIGWTNDYYVTNVLVFSPNCLILACALNTPGSMHDSIVSEWGDVYAKR